MTLIIIKSNIFSVVHVALFQAEYFLHNPASKQTTELIDKNKTPLVVIFLPKSVNFNSILINF